MTAGLTALLLCACKTDLLVGLSQRQANEAIALLQRHEIRVDKRPDGKKDFKVVVERDQFADAVELLARYHLPSREDMAIADMFPADSLVTTPMSERARMLSGVEQRLEKTVYSVEHVVSARVHVSYPVDGVGARKKMPMRVAIAVNYEGDLQENLFTEKLKRLARNSFEGLAYEDISVVLFQHRGGNGLASIRDDHPKYSSLWPSLISGVAVLAALALGLLGWRRLPLRRRGFPAADVPALEAKEPS